MKAKVSVVIPTYNRLELLPKAIDSVLNQNFRDFELIVVDDGSTDATPGLIEGYGEQVVYIRRERGGPAAARNRGIERASAALLAFLDSDDWWEREKLEIQFEAMAKKPGCLISHTQEVWYRRGRRLNQKRKHTKPRGYIFPDCLPLCVVSMSTVMVRKELFSQVGFFDEELPCCEDYDFWLRASVDHRFLLIDRPLTSKDGGRPDQVSQLYRVGMDRYRIRSLVKILSQPGLLSPDHRELALKELERKCRIYGEGCRKHGQIEEGRRYLELATRFSAAI